MYRAGFRLWNNHNGFARLVYCMGWIAFAAWCRDRGLTGSDSDREEWIESLRVER